MLNRTKIITDYHMHSTFSPDGDDPPAVLCRRALDLGFTEIALTEHAEWHPASRHNGFPRVADYFAEMEQVRAELAPRGFTVHTGVELGNPHEYAAEATGLLMTYPFDVVFGSLHWLYGENIHDECCFANRNPDQVYADYFAQLGRMAANFDFDIVAHFDRIIWRGTLLGAIFDPRRLEPVIREAMSAIAQNGKTLELNTRFLTHTPNWNNALITTFRWFREAGGRQVAINSDAHRISEIGRNMDIAQKLLVEAGFQLPEQLFRVESRVVTLA